MYKQKCTPVRFSHLMSYSGVGAIARDKDDLLVSVVDTRYWTDESGNISAENIPYVERIKSALGLSQDLRKPPEAKELENGKIEGAYIPTVLFPSFFRCKKCRMMHQNLWNKTDQKSVDNVKCEHCNSRLEQLSWCASSTLGELAEVPWHYICHKESNVKCEIDYSNSYLKLTNIANGKLQIECTRCFTINSDVQKSKLSRLNTIQPWIYEQGEQLSPQDISILEVNDPRIYSPSTMNALVIPPESRVDKSTVINRLFNNSKFRHDFDHARNNLQKKRVLKQASTKYRCSVDEISAAMCQIEDGYPFLTNIESGDLYKDEYDAFLTIMEDVSDEEDFVTEHKTSSWKELAESLTDELLSISSLVDNLIVVKRLREIQVFKGFSRLPNQRENAKPENGTENEKEEKIITAPDIVGKSDWLPAIELFGEGLFFTLNEDILSKWESIPSVRKRANEIEHRYENSDLLFNFDLTVTPRFLLLHTISHLLIRELESVAGYPAASLKERIYHSKDNKMAGILIYTAVPDIAGTLGGIIENAQPKEFLKLLSGSFKHAQWCSHDPVCTEHLGQGPSWLNRAACHACALLPETSCEFGNVFLDRVFIKGSNSLEIPNIISFIKEVADEQKDI